MNEAKLAVGGVFHVECYDKDGNLKWVDDAKNAVVTEGLNSILDIMFHATTQITTWYIGLISSSGYSALAAADTMSSHAGWTEDQAYDEATRGEWSEGASSGGVMTNSTARDFTMSGTTTIKGAFLVSNSTKGGTTGTLFCTALFTGGDQAVNDNDVLKVTYTVTATAS